MAGIFLFQFCSVMVVFFVPPLYYVTMQKPYFRSEMHPRFTYTESMTTLYPSKVLNRIVDCT